MIALQSHRDCLRIGRYATGRMKSRAESKRPRNPSGFRGLSLSVVLPCGSVRVRRSPLREAARARSVSRTKITRPVRGQDIRTLPGPSRRPARPRVRGCGVRPTPPHGPACVGASPPSSGFDWSGLSRSPSASGPDEPPSRLDSRQTPRASTSSLARATTPARKSTRRPTIPLLLYPLRGQSRERRLSQPRSSQGRLELPGPGPDRAGLVARLHGRDDRLGVGRDGPLLGAVLARVDEDG